MTYRPRLHRLAILALLAVWMAIPACATTGTTAPTPGPGPGEGDPGRPPASFSACTTDSIKSEATNIVNVIASVFATQDYEGAIKTKLGNVAADVVKCAVQFFIDATTHKAQADELAAVQLARAQAWLANH